MSEHTLWNRIRRSTPRRVLRLMGHRAGRRIFRPSVKAQRWTAELPDLTPLRALIPPPADPAPVIAMADDVCAGRFTLLGFPTFDLGAPPDWHTDPHSGHRWEPAALLPIDGSEAAPLPIDGSEATPAPTLDLMTRGSPADVRVVWELNRFHHAVAMGMAWRSTQDARYPAGFVSQVTDWLSKNPVGHGVNWTCAMEVAIRAINWLFASALMQEALAADFLHTLLGALMTHGHFVRANLELMLVNTNHYLADLCGLAVLGLALPGPEPDRWRRFALGEMAREITFQVYPDGASFEASTAYHRLAMELFDLPLRLARRTNAPVPAMLTERDRFASACSDRGCSASLCSERVPLMHAFAAAITRPDGRLPLIGDSDDGAASLPHTPIPPHPNPTPPAGTSAAFPHAGIYVMRHGDRYLICDCGPNGQRGNGGHAHNDTLSFELFAGRPWIVDPGTYMYTGDLDAYAWFRSTAAHNTVTVDGEEQARFDPDEPFLLAPDARPVVHRWESGPAYDWLDAEHSGYRRLAEPVTHRRQILFDKEDDLWLIRDLVTGRGTHQLDWTFHFAPTITGEASGEAMVRASAPDGTGLLLMPTAGPPPDLTIERGWVSYRYGSRERAPVARYTSRDVALPVEATFALVPTRRPLPGGEVQRLVEEPLAVLSRFATLS